MARVLDWIGTVLLVLAGLVIITGYIGVAIFQGLGALWDILSPFNLFNWLAVMVTIAPGIGFKVLAGKLRGRR